jgi:hypothetical protein
VAADEISLRKILTCVGGTSVRGLFKPPTFLTPPFAVRALAEVVLQRTIDLNIICVGVELMVFTPGALEKILAAVEASRLIFSQPTVDIGLGSVHLSGIPLADADGYQDIDSEEETKALRETFAPSGGTAIDVFFVQTIAGPSVGITGVPTYCDADNDSASVVALEASTDITGRALAHELTHYLGHYNHSTDHDNLMFGDVSNNGTTLTVSQGAVIRDHCILYWRCRGAA